VSNSIEWLCNNRTDLWDNRWQILSGEGKIRGVSMEGNHFTMMKEPLVIRRINGAPFGFTDSESPVDRRS
jgi:hypothetical protein